MAHNNGRAVGILFAVLQAIMYSTMGIFGKLLNGMGFDSSQVMVLRFVSTSVLLGLFMVVWHRERLIAFSKPVLLQALFFFLSAWFYFLTVEHLASAGMATVIFYLFPAVVAIVNVTLFGEKFSWTAALALVLAIGGTICVSGALIPGAVALNALGICFGILSCVSFAIYTILIQRNKNPEGTFTVTFTIVLLSTLASLVVFAPSLPSLVVTSSWQAWALGAAMALLNTIGPIVLYIVAIKRIGGTTASLISISETPFSLFFAFLILGETLTAWQAAGALLVVAGIILMTAQPLIGRRQK